MARAALNWTVRDLADRAGVSHDTIVRIEGGDQTLKDSTIAKVRAAFEVERIEFTNGNSPGVRISRTGLPSRRLRPCHGTRYDVPPEATGRRVHER
jgi:transcriptional regulator with XRE-family HTH domain